MKHLHPLRRESALTAFVLVLALSGCSDSSSGDDSAASGGSTAQGGASSQGQGGASGTSGGSAGSSSSGDGGASAGANGGSSTAGNGGTGQAGTTSSSPEAPFDWVGIIGSGQSLSTGCGALATTTTQPYSNVMLRDDGPDPKYPVDGAATAEWSLVPLIEPNREYVSGYAADDYQYPNNVCFGDGKYGETPHSAFANTLSAMWEERGMGDYVTAHTVSGRGGWCINMLDKANSLSGGRTFASGISEAKVYKALADEAGKTYGVAGILFTHGECDSSNTPNANYGTALYQLWSDYNTDLKAATGQERDVVLFASQQSGIPAGYDGPNVQLWRAGNEHPGQIVLVGPKYAYGDYGVHLPGAGAYQRLGEKHAEVFDLVVNQGVAWKPVGPNNVVRSGQTITITFDVPNPPLVWDTHLAPGHQDAHTAWKDGKGFEVKDADSNELTIESAEIDGDDVILTLAADPGNAELTVAYGLTQDADGDFGGYSAGMHGLLRDSDDFEGVPETIEVTVNAGSDMVMGAEGAFVRRANLDIVSGEGVPDDMIVAHAGSYLNISPYWSGASGTTSLTFHHNHYNYCVHFAMPVP